MSGDEEGSYNLTHLELQKLLQRLPGLEANKIKLLAQEGLTAEEETEGLGVLSLVGFMRLLVKEPWRALLPPEVAAPPFSFASAHPCGEPDPDPNHPNPRSS